jgi:proteic killer suppression protein
VRDTFSTVFYAASRTSFTLLPLSGTIGIVAIRSFKNKTSEEINYRISSKQSRKLLPLELHEKARIKLARIGAATSLQDFQELRGNRFEALKGDRKNQYSIRINNQFRICFKWDGKHAFDVEIVDYH